jgi:hypothetical protein
MSEHPKTVFISADHGLAIVYFLQSEVVPTLQGLRVVLLTDDAPGTDPAAFWQPGLIVEAALESAQAYASQHWESCSGG